MVQYHVGHVGSDTQLGHVRLDDAARVVMPSVLDA
jgi:hypothetical protein